MHTVFADACYWIALLIERDALHEVAMMLRNEMRHHHLVTSQMVLVETLNAVGRFGAVRREAAVQLVRDIHSDRHVDVIEQSPDQFWDAVSFYNARPDQEWGLVDCASFLIMESHGIHHALTNDHHFTQAGFTILM